MMLLLLPRQPSQSMTSSKESTTQQVWFVEHDVVVKSLNDMNGCDSLLILNPLTVEYWAN